MNSSLKSSGVLLCIIWQIILEEFKGWNDCIPAKCQELHTVTLQKTQILTNTSVTTSNLEEQRMALHTNCQEYMNFKATLSIVK
jgi:hypothetical protein